MTSDSLSARTAAWAGYWATGTLHSCPGSYAGNYDGAIGAFWERGLAGLMPGTRLLDVATGNGALPLRVLQQYGDAVEIHAIDLAQPSPGWYQAGLHPNVHLHGGIDMAATGFADAGFDVVCSQYGIEYGARPQALDEALRVLRPDGRLLLVLHHAGSELAEVARAESGVYAWLLAEGGMLDLASRMLLWLRAASAGEPLPQEAARDRQHYNAQVRELGARHGQGRARALAVEAVQAVHGLLALPGQGRNDEAAARLARLRVDLAHAGVRSRELCEHALSARDVQDWTQRIAAALPQAQVACQELRQEQGVLGWALHARGAAGAG